MTLITWRSFSHSCPSGKFTSIGKSIGFAGNFAFPISLPRLSSRGKSVLLLMRQTIIPGLPRNGERSPWSGGRMRSGVSTETTSSWLLAPMTCSLATEQDYGLNTVVLLDSSALSGDDHDTHEVGTLHSERVAHAGNALARLRVEEDSGEEPHTSSEPLILHHASRLQHRHRHMLRSLHLETADCVLSSEFPDLQLFRRRL